MRNSNFVKQQKPALKGPPNAWRVPNPRVKSPGKWKPAPPPTQEQIAAYYLTQHPPKNRKGRKHKKWTNWLDKKRIRQNVQCPGCKEITYNMVVIRGTYHIRCVPEMRSSFKIAYICLYRWRFPGDLIAKIMFLAFAEDVTNRELGRPIVKFPCGCTYHTKCYEQRLKTSNTCNRHYINFP